VSNIAQKRIPPQITIYERGGVPFE
jgi:hypothetical protein